MEFKESKYQWSNCWWSIAKPRIKTSINYHKTSLDRDFDRWCKSYFQFFFKGKCLGFLHGWWNFQCILVIILCFRDNFSHGSLGLISFNRDSLYASLKKPGVTRKRRKILKLVTRSHDIKEETILPVQIKSCKVIKQIWIKYISTVSHGFKRSNRRTSNMPVHTCFY